MVCGWVLNSIARNGGESESEIGRSDEDNNELG